MNFSKKFAQNFDFSRFLKKWKKVTFFHFPKTQNRCQTQNASLVQKISGFFFLFSKSLFNIIVFNIGLTKKLKIQQLKKMRGKPRLFKFLEKVEKCDFFLVSKNSKSMSNTKCQFHRENRCIFFLNLFLTFLC